MSTNDHPLVEDVWYDTEEGLSKTLDRYQLAGLHEINAGRRINYGHGQHLSEWCLLGRFHLDTCGNLSTIVEGAPADHSSYKIRKQIRYVMPWSEVRELVDGSMTSTGSGLPKITDTCDRCREGWSLHDCHDVIWYREPERPRHRICNALALIQDATKEIHEILTAAKIEGPVFLIPNRYWPPHSAYDCVRTPWAIVQTERGPIRIGWRKRVISIDWGLEGSKFTVTGSDVAAGDDTTTGQQLIHAWSPDKAVEYLQRLWNGSVNP